MQPTALHRKVESRFGENITAADWTILLISLSRERIGQNQNSMRFLLLSASKDQLIINYPALDAFLNSELGAG
jgi:hypothetical protein